VTSLRFHTAALCLALSGCGRLDYETVTEASSGIDASSVDAAAAVPFYASGFDECAGWFASGAPSWECGSQTDDAFGPPSGHSGHTVFGTRLNANYDYYSQHAYLESPEVTIPDGVRRPTLRFWMDLENETNTSCGGGMCDAAHIQLSVNGGAYTPVAFGDGGMRGIPRYFRSIVFFPEPTWGPTQPAGEWDEVVVDLWRLMTPGLDAIGPGDRIKVRFDHWSDTGVVEPGWYIDDFSMEDAAEPLPLPVPYTTGFDDWGGWYRSSTPLWEVGEQLDDAVGPPSGHSGSTVLATAVNRNLDAAGFDVSFTDSYVTSPPIDLSGSSRPHLRFWMDMETQANGDGGNVQLAVNGGRFVPLAFNDPAMSGPAHTNDGDLGPSDTNDGVGWSGTVPAGDWAEVDIDLFALGTPIIGPSDVIEIRFAAHVNNYSNTVAGWTIDDVSVGD